MPMFEFKCNKCSYSKDCIFRWEERDTKIPCEKEGCDGEMTRAEVQRSNFHLKGEGWHDKHGGVR